MNEVDILCSLTWRHYWLLPFSTVNIRHKFGCRWQHPSKQHLPVTTHNLFHNWQWQCKPIHIHPKASVSNRSDVDTNYKPPEDTDDVIGLRLCDAFRSTWHLCQLKGLQKFSPRKWQWVCPYYLKIYFNKINMRLIEVQIITESYFSSIYMVYNFKTQNTITMPQKWYLGGWLIKDLVSWNVSIITIDNYSKKLTFSSVEV